MKFDKDKFLEPFAKVAELPDEMIKQNAGVYQSGKPCCVGAHLAGILSCGFGKPRDYVRGVDEWMRRVGGNRAHAAVMLQEATGYQNPLSGAKWDMPVKSVYEKLCAVEKLPSLVGADFFNHDMVSVDFNGMDLSGASFYDANVSFSEFDGACLKGANFRAAEARHTSFKQADLRKADFRFAHMPESDFYKANLTDANLYNAYLHKANLQQTDFTNAYVKDASLHLAKLDGAMFLNCKIMEAKLVPVSRMTVES